MKAILLAGGKGTRLRPLTVHTPKPIVPIFDRPFLHYQLDLLKHVPEIDEVILSLNYQPRRIEEIFGDGSESGLGIRYVVEPAPLGTGPQFRLDGDVLGTLDLGASQERKQQVVDRLTKGLESLTSSGFMDALPGSIKSVKDALDRVGGVDWLGDGAAVLTKNGNAFGGGIVAQATDAATARTKVDLITNLVSLTSGATKATSRDETYKGVGITVISIPASAQTPLVEIAIGAKDNLIVAGYTDSFVKAVIDTTTSDSLASQSDYSNAIGASGNSNMESMYVNVPALEDLMGRTAMSANPARWTQDYKPYFDHIGGVAYSVVDGNTVTMRFVVMAR